MNIFNKVALQGLKKSRTRTLITIVGVILSAALITGVATFGVSMLHYMINGAEEKYGSWHVKFENVDSDFVRQREHDKETASTVVIENIGYAALEGSKTEDKPYLFVTGFSKEAFSTLPITLYSGRMPENSKEILVSGQVATKAGVSYSVGDTITLAVGNRISGNEKLSQRDSYMAEAEVLKMQNVRTYTVVGICRTPEFEEESAPGYTMITCSHANDTKADLSLFVTLKNPRQIHSYAEKNAQNQAYLFNDPVLRFMGLADGPENKLFNALLYSVGAIVIIIIMVGSVFLIYNSFNISLNERTHQFGILSSVGATARQLRNSVLFEGVCIGAIGIPVGVLVGIGSIGLVIDGVAKNFANILYSTVPLTLTISVPAILTAVIVSLITILISAYIPAKKAVNTPIMECIRQTNEIKVETKAVKTSNMAKRMYGLEGTLALKNFRRNKKRYRSIVLSLVLSVVLFIATSSFVIAVKQTAEQATVVTTYDIGLSVPEMDDSKMVQLFDQMKTADDITESSYQELYNCQGRVKAELLSDAYWESQEQRSQNDTIVLPMRILFLDDASFQNIVQDLGLTTAAYTGPNAKLIAVAKMRGDTGRQGQPKESPDMFKSDSINLAAGVETNGEVRPEQEQSISLTVVETVPPDTLPVLERGEQQPYIFEVLAPYGLKEEFQNAKTSSVAKGMTFSSDNPAQSAAEMEAVIKGAGITTEYNLLNVYKMMDESRNYIFIANVFSYIFIVMISLIAIANVFNTISTNIKLRRRELAMLRSVGMSDRSFNRMMRYECAFYGMRALLVGLPLSLAASWLIYKGMYAGGADNIEFILPWTSILISTGSVLLVIFVTMMYAVNRIKKENIIDALRDDMD